MRKTNLLAALAATAAIALAVSAPLPAFASAGNSFDPESGHICVTLPCDYVVPRGANNVICKKIWPDNDHRRKAELKCYSKVDGRWVES